jgi:hypothetical protein
MLLKDKINVKPQFTASKTKEMNASMTGGGTSEAYRFREIDNEDSGYNLKDEIEFFKMNK